MIGFLSGHSCFGGFDRGFDSAITNIITLIIIVPGAMTGSVISLVIIIFACISAIINCRIICTLIVTAATITATMIICLRLICTTLKILVVNGLESLKTVQELLMESSSFLKSTSTFAWDPISSSTVVVFLVPGYFSTSRKAALFLCFYFFSLAIYFFIFALLVLKIQCTLFLQHCDI